jgi:hypothetical protein
MSTYSRFIAIAGLLLLGLTSCDTLKQYEQAMSAFNSAAAADNFADLGAAIPKEFTGMNTLFPGGQPIDDPQSAYERSLELLNTALAKPQALREGNLLGSAFVLRGLSNWQLENFAAARADAAEARILFRESDPNDNPRDYPLAYALDDLANLDSIRGQYVALVEDAPAEDAAAAQAEYYAQLKAFYQQHATATGDDALSWAQSLANLDRTIEQQTRDEATTRYLRNVQMTALRNWAGALDELRSAGQRGGVFRANSAEADWFTAESGAFRKRRDAALEKLAASVSGGENSEVYKFWRDII